MTNASTPALSLRLVALCACILSAVLVLIAVSNHPRDFYTLMRFIVFCTGILSAWVFNRRTQPAFALVFVVAALLFNPFFPINLRRSTWEPIDLAAAALFAFGAYRNWKLGALNQR